MKQFEFNKKERLRLKHSIDTLFNEGNSFSIKFLRIIYYSEKSENSYLIKTLFAVSKKKFKRAVDRNRIKRLLREAYRLNKNILYSVAGTNSANQLNVAFIYYGDNGDITYNEIEPVMIAVLTKLIILLNK